MGGLKYWKASSQALTVHFYWVKMAHHDHHIENEPVDLLEELARAEKDHDIRIRRELTPQEELRRQHMQFHEKHKGHEQMRRFWRWLQYLLMDGILMANCSIDAEMFIILIVTLLVAQIILVEWKKRQYRWVWCLVLVLAGFIH